MTQQIETSLPGFRSALDGPLGPTTLAYSLRSAVDEIDSLRRSGASWKQICAAINSCLQDAGREPVGSATLRGMIARLDSTHRVRNVPPPSDARLSGPSQPSPTVPERAPEPQTPNSSISGESEPHAGGTLSDAAEFADRLNKLRSIR
jgi:hypothetical protein